MLKYRKFLSFEVNKGVYSFVSKVNKHFYVQMCFEVNEGVYSLASKVNKHSDVQLT